jgi:hypothetical protein
MITTARPPPRAPSAMWVGRVGWAIRAVRLKSSERGDRVSRRDGSQKTRQFGEPPRAASVGLGVDSPRSLPFQS